MRRRGAEGGEERRKGLKEGRMKEGKNEDDMVVVCSYNLNFALS